ncbi:hypothetical protein CNW10_1773 [Lactiplantibacillus plantarum]|nr:hypothetical protein CNW10_1773 [Lactiplantibacillus plantarum]
MIHLNLQVISYKQTSFRPISNSAHIDKFYLSMKTPVTQKQGTGVLV